MDSSYWLDRLEVFFGDANNALARIYARLEPFPNMALADCFLAGRVRGPVCAYSQTLSATMPLVAKDAKPSQGSQAKSLLAEAVVPDPCFWTAELPLLYRVEVELRLGSQVLAVQERTLGIRPLGVRGRRLVFEGRPWAPRGVHVTEPDLLEYSLRLRRIVLLPRIQFRRLLVPWREATAVMCLDRPADALCAAASHWGVLMLAWLTGDGEQIESELRRLARFPCIAAAVIPVEAMFDAPGPSATRNLLLAQHFGPDMDVRPAHWADLVICQDEADGIVRSAATCPLPVIAERLAGRHCDLAAARALCDRLQRDLAGQGDFAGYIV